MKKIVSVLLGFLALTSNFYAQLDLKQIMSGSNFVGNSPESYHWSADGQSIYFYWNPENTIGSSLYAYALKDQKYAKLSDSLANTVVFYDPLQRDFQRQFMSDEGVLWSIDKMSGNRQVHLQTTNSVYNVQRSKLPEIVLFQQGDQAYSLNTKSGSIRQLTNFKAGEQKNKLKDSSFLEKQQVELFEFIQEKNKRGDFYKNQADQTRFSFPKEQFVGASSWNEIQVDPSVNYAVFRVSEEVDSKPTSVEQFITNDGFTKHQLARDKVSAEEPNQKLFLYQLIADTLINIDFSKLTDIRLKPAYLREKDTASLYKKDRSIFIHAVKFAQSQPLALCDVRSADNKDRWIVLIDLEKATVKEIEHQHDEAWIGGPGISSWNEADGNMDWIVDGESFYFQSEETGYSTVYQYHVLQEKKSCLWTEPKTEVYEVRLSKNRKQMYLEYNHCANGKTGNHSFGCLNLENGLFTSYLHLQNGYNEVLLSPDEKNMVVRQSFANKPWELYLGSNMPSKTNLKKITHSTTKEFESYSWIDPQVISIPASDGIDIFARVYEPTKDVKNGAAIFFVHGAGYLQNAHHYWSNYYREYMFHHLLREKGYTVIDLDYRASQGYGRDYRTAIYRHMGGRDLEDFVDAKAFVVKNYGIDSKRVGMYGGSYGGFITLMGLLTKPDEFACGAALRSVTDWAHYNHEYTSNILNNPDTDPESYRISSPIYFAENLQDPLLMLHGMVDDNVQFQDVVRLSQRFIELGKKDWDLAVYPVESHGFKESYSWYDEYRRILELMEKHLK